MEIKIDNEFKNRIPTLSTDEYKLLESNIIKDGCRDSIVLWNNVIVDGHNRYKICQTHDISFNTIAKEFNDRPEVLDWIDANALGKRNLTPDQRKIIIGRRYNAEKAKQNEFKGNQYTKSAGGQNVHQQKTSEKLAEEYGIDQRSVRRYAKDAELFDQIQKEDPNLANEIWASTPKKNNRKSTSKDEKEKGSKSLKDVKKEISKQKKEETNKKKQEDRKKEIEKIGIDVYKPDIRKGRFQDICKDIADNSIDHIITDPPYPKEFLQDWSDMAEVANRILKPGGFCVCYSGKIHLPEVIKRMTEHLEYYWQMILLHKGAPAAVHPVKINTLYKPILVFHKPPRTPQNTYITDIIQGTGREKYGHEWQQAEDELKQVLEWFTNEGDLILDPFAGSGTTGMACMKNNRRSILIDINDV